MSSHVLVALMVSAMAIGAADRYCALFSSADEVADDAMLRKRKNAPAPGACP